MNDYYDFIKEVFSLEKEALNVSHMILRGIVVYFFGMIATRLNKRFIGIRTQFNFILYVMLGSLLATAITGNAPFFPVIGMTAVLIMLNWILVKLSYFFPSFEKLFKGFSEELVNDGNIQWKEMKKNAITQKDLMELIRVKTGTTDLQKVKNVFLESNGNISIILKD
jgi:uncharacterized membrane protein YcaP (DUF421 family)